MSEYFLLYLFTRLDVVGAMLTLSGLTLLVVTPVVWIAAIEDDSGTTLKRFAKRITFAAVVCWTLFAITPSQKDVALIVGGKLALDISRSQPVQDLASKIYNIVNKKLDEAAK